MPKPIITGRINPSGAKELYVEIKPLGNYGGREITIDGDKWAEGFLNSRGPHGYFYTFVDAERNGIYRAGARRKNEFSLWQIWSDKHAGRDLKPGEVLQPLAERMLSNLSAMIRSGQLRSPAECKQATVDAMAKFRAEREAEEKAEQAALDAKAEEVLIGVMIFDEDRAELKRRIVEAMKWAKAQ